MAPRHYRGHHRGSGVGRAVFGLSLVTWGVLALLDTLGIYESSDLLQTYWPLLLVIWGLTRIAFSSGRWRWRGLFWVGLGGILLGNRVLGWHINLFSFWPLLLIAFGMRMLIGRRFPCGHRMGVRTAPLVPGDPLPPTTDPEPIDHSVDPDPGSTLREFALLGGVERRNTSQTFRGGEATAVLGGVELDLRECRMSEPSAHIEVFALMGGISMKIPRDWTVESRVSAILGGFDDRSAPPVDANPKRLVISGQAVMGGIEVKN